MHVKRSIHIGNDAIDWYDVYHYIFLQLLLFRVNFGHLPFVFYETENIVNGR